MPIPTVLRPTVKISPSFLYLGWISFLFWQVLVIMVMIIDPAPPVEVGSCAGAAGIEDDGKVNLSGRWRRAQSWNYHADDVDADDDNNCNFRSRPIKATNKTRYCRTTALSIHCKRPLSLTIFSSLMKRRSWSIMRQPNQAAIVPISRIEKGVVKMQPSKKKWPPCGANWCQWCVHIISVSLSSSHF